MPSAASGAADTSADALQEVVVTAQFRKQNLQDTPLAITAVNAAMLEARGAEDVTVLCLIVARPGVDLVTSKHPRVTIVAAALDEELNDIGYITPGLGDAGDRLFGPPVR